jgi:CRP-like cAMP-binding protein
MFTRTHLIHPSLRTSELATAVPLEELEELDRLATTIHVREGERIVRQDGFGRECFVVIDGEFRIERDDLTVTVGPGSVIGELALLTGKPRNATVTATTDASVYVLNRSEFVTLLHHCPSIARHVFDGALRRTAAAA